METSSQDRQQRIEAHAAELAGVTRGPDQTMRESYGEMDDWIFHLGPWEFLLDPASRRWLYLDLAHNEYLDTGYGAGEAVFELAGEVGFAPPPRRPERSPAPAASASPPTEPQARFCMKCGAAVEAGWKFCAHCKAAVYQADTK
jgi:hypothetical protein